MGFNANMEENPFVTGPLHIIARLQTWLLMLMDFQRGPHLFTNIIHTPQHAGEDNKGRFHISSLLIRERDCSESFDVLGVAVKF